MGEHGGFQTIDGTLRANKFATSDADTEFLYTPPKYGQFLVDNNRFAIRYARIQNVSGGAAVVGIGSHYEARDWKFGSWGTSGSLFTDNTAVSQLGTATFTLETTTNNDGHLVACVRPFNLIDYNVSVTSASATTSVRALHYSKADGTWATIATGAYYVGPPTGAVWGVGERTIWFTVPSDWSGMLAAHGTNVPIGYYGIRILATTAPTTTAAGCTRIVVGRTIAQQGNVANNAEWEVFPSYHYKVYGAHVHFAVSRDTDTATVPNSPGSNCTAQVKISG